MKIVSIVGARPEFVQATPVSKAIRLGGQHHEVLVHTGQHYDYKMSQTFFDELGTPTPDYNLEAGSGTHGQQTADMLVGIEQVLQQEQPDLVIIRGDTNSTVAGALAASKLHIRLAHIEAGERSFDRRMPEEINRLVADRIADLHFCVSQTAVKNLADEGIVASAHHVGDVMLDAMRHNQALAQRKSAIVSQLGLRVGGYVLVTVHRAANTDNATRLRGIVHALNAAQETVVFPVHPRTRSKIDALGVQFAPHVRAIEPVGYFDMIALENNARMIATDSGGVQREAYFLGKPCITLRDETEWTETVQVGWNILVGAEPERIMAAWHTFSPPSNQPPIFGNGFAAEKIVAILEERVNPER
jgi:UDP-N-acetylglucosamine 2-epimerase